MTARVYRKQRELSPTASRSIGAVQKIANMCTYIDSDKWIASFMRVPIFDVISIRATLPKPRQPDNDEDSEKAKAISIAETDRALRSAAEIASADLLDRMWCVYGARSRALGITPHEAMVVCGGMRA